MGVVNRTLDASEQRKTFEVKLVAAELVTGFSGVICQVPFASTLDAASMAAYGVSNAPTVQIAVHRGGGAGATYVLAVGTSNLPLSYGTSGAWNFVLPASGSTLLNLNAGDNLLYLIGGSNAAAVNANISVVLKPLQDIKTQFGV